MIEYFKSLGYGDKFEVVVVNDIVNLPVKVGNQCLSTISSDLTPLAAFATAAGYKFLIHCEYLINQSIPGCAESFGSTWPCLCLY
jgi:hypothetical protein